MPTSIPQNSYPSGIIWIAKSALVVLMVFACGNPAPVSDESGTADPSQIPEILRMEDRVVSIEKLAGLLLELPKTGETAEEVVAAFDETATDRGDIELVLVAEWWTPFDPDGAFEWSRTQWRADHPRITYAVLRAMARLDPQKAIDAYHSVPVGAETFAVYLQPVIVGWFESGRSDLLTFILSLPSSDLQQLGLGTLARLQVLAIGPERSIAWAEAITADQGETFRRQILQRIAASIAELEPQVAADWVEKLIREEGASQTLLRRVAGRWSRRDPVAAFAWLARFPSTDHQKQAISQTFALWHARDPFRSEEWLFEQGEAIGTIFAPATEVVLKGRATHAKQHPDQSVHWQENLDLALRIQDKASRWAAVSRLCRIWITRDEAATRAWMDANAVPDTYRYKIEAALPSAEEMRPRS